MSKKLLGVLIGAGVVVFGVLLLLAGIVDHKVLNIVIAVLLMLGGAACGVVAVLGLVKEKKLEFNLCLGAFGGLWLGLALILEKLDIFGIVGILFVAVPAIGLALIAHGVYMICKKETVPGIVKVAVGVAATTVAMLYIFVPSFVDVFWIIAGILVMLFGVYLAVMALLKKE